MFCQDCRPAANVLSMLSIFCQDCRAAANVLSMFSIFCQDCRAAAKVLSMFSIFFNVFNVVKIVDQLRPILGKMVALCSCCTAAHMRVLPKMAVGSFSSNSF